MLLLLLAGAAAVVAGWFLTPLVVRASRVWELYDVPSDGRRVHTQPIPRLGGVAVFGATVLSLAFAASISLVEGWGTAFWQMRLLLGLLAGGTLLLLAGMFDDIKGLRPLYKLGAQVVAAVIVFALGFQVQLLSVGPASDIALGWLSLPLTILWIVGVTNAFNLIDGLDGLATGIALVTLLTTLGVALMLGNYPVALVAVALSGSLVGFLRYNFSPARIFLGDSGSLFVGFMLAVLSVYGSMKSATAVLTIVPLSALALPLLDTGVAILRRWLRGVPLTGGDARHIHHRLLALGLSHRRVALVMCAVAGTVAVMGLLLAFAPPPMVIAIATLGGCVSLALLLFGAHHLDYHEFAAAGAVLVSGVFRVRRVIQDQIHARDLVEIISRAKSLSQVDAVLEDNAGNFGFAGIEVCRECSEQSRFVEARQESSFAWKIDYPLSPEVDRFNPFILRIWCDAQSGSRPLGALRVAQILAPAVERWFEHEQIRQIADRPELIAAGPDGSIPDPGGGSSWQQRWSDRRGSRRLLRITP